jgi:hypothetical protein
MRENGTLICWGNLQGLLSYTEGLGSPDGQSYYTRPDLKVQVGGLAFIALNDRLFSYWRASCKTNGKENLQDLL